jgi:hypothetical protein
MLRLPRNMNRSLLAGIACLWLSGGSHASGQSYLEGNVVSLIEQIRNQMPGISTDAFVIPSDAQMDLFGDVIKKMKEKDFADIQSMIDPYGYQFIKYHDIISGDTLYILKENYPVGRGWGTFIYRPTGSLDMDIEVPHPIWDTKSWRLGMNAFLRLGAEWFMMAGTHRYANSDSSSDVAHVTRSVFHRAHQVISSSRAIQIHGFNNSDPSYDGYPDIVISSGNLYPPNILFVLKFKFEGKYFSSGVYSMSTQSSLSKLAATTNKQGQFSNANGLSFVHIEFDTPIRTDSIKSSDAVEALLETFGISSGVDQIDEPYTESIRLFQNYPNPFNPDTKIKFKLKQTGFVSLKVFDLAGKEVASIVEGIFIPGEYFYIWESAKDKASSGLYFSILEINGETQIRKMILLK